MYFFFFFWVIGRIDGYFNLLKGNPLSREKYRSLVGLDVRADCVFYFSLLTVNPCLIINKGLMIQKKNHFSISKSTKTMVIGIQQTNFYRN